MNRAAAFLPSTDPPNSVPPPFQDRSTPARTAQGRPIHVLGLPIQLLSIDFPYETTLRRLSIV